LARAFDACSWDLEELHCNVSVDEGDLLVLLTNAPKLRLVQLQGDEGQAAVSAVSTAASFGDSAITDVRLWGTAVDSANLFLLTSVTRQLSLVDAQLPAPDAFRHTPWSSERHPAKCSSLTIGMWQAATQTAAVMAASVVATLRSVALVGSLRVCFHKAFTHAAVFDLLEAIMLCNAPRITILLRNDLDFAVAVVCQLRALTDDPPVCSRVMNRLRFVYATGVWHQCGALPAAVAAAAGDMVRNGSARHVSFELLPFGAFTPQLSASFSRARVAEGPSETEALLWKPSNFVPVLPDDHDVPSPLHGSSVMFRYAS